jgi:hypothetical protein
MKAKEDPAANRDTSKTTVVKKAAKVAMVANLAVRADMGKAMAVLKELEAKAAHKVTVDMAARVRKDRAMATTEAAKDMAGLKDLVPKAQETKVMALKDTVGRSITANKVWVAKVE